LKQSNLIPKFAPGFRLSWRDVIVLVVGITGSIALDKTFWPASLIIAFAVGHFFLFCNVFRISRRLELIWTGIFIALSCVTIWAGFPGWAATIAISICATIVVVICEMKKPSYHGVSWRKINPHLKTWWDSNLADQNPN
jgi:hypothetical protein